MQTPTAPSRCGRPWLSLIRTATGAPNAAWSASRMARAEASGSRGRRLTTSGPRPTLLWSTPAFAEMKPSRCSVISTPCCARTTRVDSRSTTSTSRGSLSIVAAIRTASDPGRTAVRSTTLPSALLTIFCATTSASPAAGARSADRRVRTISAGRSVPGPTSGNPGTAISVTWAMNGPRSRRRREAPQRRQHFPADASDGRALVDGGHLDGDDVGAGLDERPVHFDQLFRRARPRVLADDLAPIHAVGPRAQHGGIHFLEPALDAQPPPRGERLPRLVLVAGENRPPLRNERRLGPSRLARGFEARIDDLLPCLSGYLHADDQSVGEPPRQLRGQRRPGRHPDRHAAKRRTVEPRLVRLVELAGEVELLAVQQAAHDRHGLGHAGPPLLVPGELPAERPLVDALAAADAEREAPAGQAVRRGRGLRDQRGMIAKQRTRDLGREPHARGARGGRAEPAPDKRRRGRVVDPGMEVIGDRQRVEPRRLRLRRVIEQRLGLELFRAAEVRELGHHIPLRRRTALRRTRRPRCNPSRRTALRRTRRPPCNPSRRTALRRTRRPPCNPSRRTAPRRTRRPPCNPSRRTA